MTNPITFFERQIFPYQALNLSPNDPLIEVLDRLNQSTRIEIIRLERKEMRASQYVGIIQVGTRLIQILPKIDCDPYGHVDALIGSEPYEIAARSAAQNFMFLLSHAQNLKLHNQTLATLRTSHGTWLEILTRLFAVELMVQLQQGFHQDYILREELLPYVRGRWNISRQFVRQPNLVKGLDVTFDDYSQDTLLNRIFRHTIMRLLQVTRDPQNRCLLANLETWLLPAQVQIQIRPDDLGHIQFTRLNERYLPAFQLAQLFLEGQTVQLLAGGQHAYAFVFDMDRLFEQFIANLLKSHSKRILPEAWSDCQIELQGSKSTIYLIQPPNPAEKPMFHLEPDILIKLFGVPHLIIDTKNKALPIQQPYRAISEGDAYQVLSYALRFRCPNVLLLYPRTLGMAQLHPQCLQVEGTPVRIFVATLDLHQPLEHLVPLVRDFRKILEYIHLHALNPVEVIWPV